MNSNIKIRLMKADDFDAIVRIDERVLKVARPDYYKMKFEKLVQSKDYVPTSLVAEKEDGTVVGFAYPSSDPFDRNDAPIRPLAHRPEIRRELHQVSNGGAARSTSSIVVSPAATFSAPETRSERRPSRAA